MEYCDGASLASALRGGAFSTGCAVAGVAGSPMWLHLYLTLLEVASALRCVAEHSS